MNGYQFLPSSEKVHLMETTYAAGTKIRERSLCGLRTVERASIIKIAHFDVHHPSHCQTCYTLYKHWSNR